MKNVPVPVNELAGQLRDPRFYLFTALFVVLFPVALCIASQAPFTGIVAQPNFLLLPFALLTAVIVILLGFVLVSIFKKQFSPPGIVFVIWGGLSFSLCAMIAIWIAKLPFSAVISLHSWWSYPISAVLAFVAFLVAQAWEGFLWKH